jgi:hypothetical protein
MYGVGIALKMSHTWPEKRVSTLSIIGFIIAIISTVTTNFIAKSFHSFY